MEFLKFTSATTGCGFWLNPTTVVTVEPWEPGMIDPMGLVPDNSQTVIRVASGLGFPVTEDVLQVLEMIQEALS